MRDCGLRLIEEFELPWSVPISGKKKFSLNLNQYRNAHYLVLSKAKNVFNQSVIPPRSRNLPEIFVKYIVNRKGKARIDTMNVVSIADKFFLDFLVMWGAIPDDNSDIVHHLAPEVIRNKTGNSITAQIYIDENT